MRTPVKGDPRTIHVHSNESKCKTEGCERWAFDEQGICRPCEAGKPPGKNAPAKWKPPAAKVKPSTNTRAAISPLPVRRSSPEARRGSITAASMPGSQGSSEAAIRPLLADQLFGPPTPPRPPTLYGRAASPPKPRTPSPELVRKNPESVRKKENPNSIGEHLGKTCTNCGEEWAFGDSTTCRNCSNLNRAAGEAERADALVPLTLDPARSFAPPVPRYVPQATGGYLW